VLFEDDDWPAKIADTLCRFKVCQVFSHVSIDYSEGDCTFPAISSANYLRYRKHLLDQPSLSSDKVLEGKSGYGWAARAEVLKKVLLYDRAIVGGGDRLILGGSFYREPHIEAVESMVKFGQRCTACGWQWHSKPYTDHYLAWARRWHKEVNGDVGYSPLRIKDLYHGQREFRFYKRRRRILVSSEFDPISDVAEDRNGVLKWASDKPQLHEDVKLYFYSRREDA
jgi:hypothetical protein